MNNWFARPLLTLAATAVTTSAVALPSLAQGDRGRQAVDERRINEHESQMKNVDFERARSRDPKALLEQVNEDFARIKAINVEVIEVSAAASALDHKAIAQATDEIKKRATRLKTNLALPAPAKDEKREKNQDKPADGQNAARMKSSLAALNELIRNFAANPVFKASGAVDQQLAAQPRRDLEAIIDLSDKLKRAAEKLDKASNKSD